MGRTSASTEKILVFVVFAWGKISRSIAPAFRLVHSGSSAITALSAIAALIFTYYQIETQRELQAQAAVYQAYNAFLEKSLEYPDFICVDSNTKLEWMKNTPDPTSIYHEMMFVRYKTYRQLMMSTMEQILLAVPNRREWVKSVDIRIRCHLPYYASKDFTADRYLGWTCVMRALINRDLVLERKTFGIVKDLRCNANEWRMEPRTGLLRSTHIDFDKMLGSI